MTRTALIVGAGAGISASFARALHADGYQVVLASRHPEKVAGLGKEIGAETIACDATDPAAVDSAFFRVDDIGNPLGIVLYNPSFRTRGALLDLKADDVWKTLQVTAFGGFLVGQAAARRMVSQGEGAIFFTGASASVKGYAGSAPFAMGKFALRGLAQSMARELQPRGVHVAHFIIDGGVRSDTRPGRMEDAGDAPDKWLAPDAIAETYMAVLRQPRSAWTFEVDLRPWVETF